MERINEVNEWQRKVVEFEQRSGQTASVEHRLIDLVSEVGELAKEVLKGNQYGKETFKITDEWLLELGDCIYSLCSLANLTHCNLEQALEAALAKYEHRFSKKGNSSS